MAKSAKLEARRLKKESKDQPVYIRLEPCQLDWYFRQQLIDKAQLRAGSRFRSDFLLSGLQYRNIEGSSEWMDPRYRGNCTPQDRSDAQERIKNALFDVPMECSAALISVFGLDKAVKGDELDELIVGLDALSNHYSVNSSDVFDNSDHGLLHETNEEERLEAYTPGWQSIEQMLLRGESPHLDDLAAQLRGNEPIPGNVRWFIADVLEGNEQLKRPGRPRNPQALSVGISVYFRYQQLSEAGEKDPLRTACDEIAELIGKPSDTVEKWYRLVPPSAKIRRR
jgi:hypothetical protein